MKIKIIFTTLLLLAVCFNPLSAQEESNSLENQFTQLETALNERDLDYFESLLDVSTILKRAFRLIDVDSELARNASQNFSQNGAKLIANRLLVNLPEGKRIKLINYSTNNQYSNALYRFDFGDNGFAYIRFNFRVNQDDSVKIVDWYDYSAGQNYSESLASIFRNLFPGSGFKAVFEKYFGDKEQLQKDYTKLFKLIKSQDKEELKKFYNTMQEPIKKDWIAVKSFMSVPSVVNDEEFYKLLLNDIAKNFENDERAGFLLIDHYFYTNEFNKVLPILDRLDTSLGTKDAGILFLRASTLLSLEQFDKSNQVADECIQKEPTFEDCYWIKVNVEVTRKQHSATVNALQDLADNFDYLFERESFDSDPFYADFLKSKEFEIWIGQ